VKNGRASGVATGRRLFGRQVILAPGRIGADWNGNDRPEIRAGSQTARLEVGVRVEVHNDIMQDLCDVIYDPTFSSRPPIRRSHPHVLHQQRRICVPGELQRFCLRQRPRLPRSQVGEHHFAFLSKVVLTEPVTDNQSYGEAIGSLATLIGGGKPFCSASGPQARPPQHWNRIHKGYIRPTLTTWSAATSPWHCRSAFSPISSRSKQAESGRPGVSNDETLLYAPRSNSSPLRLKPAMISKPPSPVFTSPATGPVSPETSSQRPPPACSGQGILSKIARSFNSKGFESPQPRMSMFDPIAIVGMAGLFPRALDITTFWSHICAKIDATAEVREGAGSLPLAKWSAEIFSRTRPIPPVVASCRILSWIPTASTCQPVCSHLWICSTRRHSKPHGRPWKAPPHRN